MTKAKFVTELTVIDPDSGGPVAITVYKMETGGMFAVDASFLEQDVGPVYSPFDRDVEIELQDGPEDEDGQAG